MTRETLEQAVERVKAATGFEPDRPAEEVDGWHYGERAFIVDDTDRYFAGTAGYTVVEHVGAAKYNNERVVLMFLEDGTDVPDEVDPFLIEAG